MTGPGKTSASIKCGERLTRPERRDQNHANSLKTTPWALMWRSPPRQAGAEHLCQALLMCTSGSGCCTPGSFRAGRQSRPSHPSWREEGRQAARSATQPGCRWRIPPIWSLCRDVQLPSRQAVTGRVFLASTSDLDWRAVGRVHH